MTSQDNSATATAATTNLPRSRAATVCANARFHAVAFAVACGMVISRRPDVIWNPQFWAEDGTRWYAEAYQHGIRALLIPSTGYFVTLPRLVALLAQWVPLALAPLLFNLVALAVQVLPVSLLLSVRYAFVGSVSRRVLFSVIYLALPNSTEINVNLTNAQWHLALLGCMILVAGSAPSRWWKAFDLIVITLLAVTGPFTILLAPIAVLAYWRGKDRWLGLLGGVVLGGALLQAVSLAGNPRSTKVVGATWHQFIRITGHQVFWASLFGSTGFWIPDPQPRWYFDLLVITVILGTMILVYTLYKGPFRLKLFLGFSLAVLAASLTSPLGEWRVLHWPGSAGRYWFFPMLGFLACLLWLASGERIPRKLKWAAISLLLCMSSGIARDWRYPPLVDFHFQGYAREFARVPKNTQFEIPINPSGWTMTLVKK